MPSPLYVLGVDPGLAHFGWSVVGVVGKADLVIPEEMRVIITRKGPGLVSADTVRRTRELAEALEEVFAARTFAAIFVEAMSFPRSATAASKMQAAWGVLLANAVRYNLPLIHQSPQTIKRIMTGSHKSTKQRVARALRDKYGKRVITELLKAGKVKRADEEHPYDALASATSILSTPQGMRVVLRKT